MLKMSTHKTLTRDSCEIQFFHPFTVLDPLDDIIPSFIDHFKSIIKWRGCFCRQLLNNLSVNNALTNALWWSLAMFVYLNEGGISATVKQSIPINVHHFIFSLTLSMTALMDVILLSMLYILLALLYLLVDLLGFFSEDLQYDVHCLWLLSLLIPTSCFGERVHSGRSACSSHFSNALHSSLTYKC